MPKISWPTLYDLLLQNVKYTVGYNILKEQEAITHKDSCPEALPKIIVIKHLELFLMPALS